MPPLKTKKPHQTWVTRRVYTTAAGGSCGSRSRARRSTTGGPNRRLSANSSSNPPFTSTG
jgi:hypothetical protein